MIRREPFGEFLQRNIQITFVGIREAGQPTDGRAKNFVAFFYSAVADLDRKIWSGKKIPSDS